MYGDFLAASVICRRSWWSRKSGENEATPHRRPGGEPFTYRARIRRYTLQHSFKKWLRHPLVLRLDHPDRFWCDDNVIDVATLRDFCDRVRDGTIFGGDCPFDGLSHKGLRIQALSQVLDIPSHADRNYQPNCCGSPNDDCPTEADPVWKHPEEHRSAYKADDDPQPHRDNYGLFDQPSPNEPACCTPYHLIVPQSCRPAVPETPSATCMLSPFMTACEACACRRSCSRASAVLLSGSTARSP